MEGITFSLLTALWLGILTSMSPCPLASNIAAVSFIIKRVDKTAAVLSSGMSYILGRVVGYTLLGAFITSSLLSIPQTSHFLQTYMNKILGPVLIVTGLFLLEVVQFPSLGFSVSKKVIARLKNPGMMGSLLLGILFALSFCPISVAKCPKSRSIMVLLPPVLSFSGFLRLLRKNQAMPVNPLIINQENTVLLSGWSYFNRRRKRANQFHFTFPLIQYTMFGMRFHVHDGTWFNSLLFNF
jgi:hypothetical protein